MLTSQELSILVFETGFLTSLRLASGLDWLASQPQESSVSTSPAVGLEESTIMPSSSYQSYRL